jgi:hypothetical protein
MHWFCILSVEVMALELALVFVGLVCLQISVEYGHVLVDFALL